MQQTLLLFVEQPNKLDKEVSQKSAFFHHALSNISLPLHTAIFKTDLLTENDHCVVLITSCSQLYPRQQTHCVFLRLFHNKSHPLFCHLKTFNVEHQQKEINVEFELGVPYYRAARLLLIVVIR